MTWGPSFPSTQTWGAIASLWLMIEVCFLARNSVFFFHLLSTSEFGYSRLIFCIRTHTILCRHKYDEIKCWIRVPQLMTIKYHITPNVRTWISSAHQACSAICIVHVQYDCPCALHMIPPCGSTTSANPKTLLCGWSCIHISSFSSKS